MRAREGPNQSLSLRQIPKHPDSRARVLLLSVIGSHRRTIGKRRGDIAGEVVHVFAGAAAVRSIVVNPFVRTGDAVAGSQHVVGNSDVHPVGIASTGADVINTVTLCHGAFSTSKIQSISLATGSRRRAADVIVEGPHPGAVENDAIGPDDSRCTTGVHHQIGRASCRERV